MSSANLRGNPSRQRHPKLRVAGTLLSLSLLAWLLAHQDWRVVQRLLGAMGWETLILSQLLFFGGLVVNAVRWYGILRLGDIPVGLWRAARLTFAGLFASNFLPSTIGGDVVRVIGLTEAGSPKRAFASVVLDRAFNVLAVLCFLPLAFQSLGPLLLSPQGLRSSGWLPGPVARLLQQGKGQISEAVRWWQGRWGVLALYGISVSLLSLIFPYTGLWVLAQGLQIPISWAQITGVTVVVYFASLLPISVNGYGVAELTFVSLLTWLGASTAQATSLALLFRLQMMLSSLPGALWLSEGLPAKVASPQAPPPEGGPRP